MSADLMARPYHYRLDGDTVVVSDGRFTATRYSLDSLSHAEDPRLLATWFAVRADIGRAATAWERFGGIR